MFAKNDTQNSFTVTKSEKTLAQILCLCTLILRKQNSIHVWQNCFSQLLLFYVNHRTKPLM